MKYLKRFESLDNYDGIEKLSIDEYYDYIDNKKFVSFTDNQYKQINNIIPVEKNQQFVDNYLYYNLSNGRFVIDQIEDEWYLLKVLTDIQMEYYKCDQFDALLRLLRMPDFVRMKLT
jgi:hypothetical protein